MYAWLTDPHDPVFWVGLAFLIFLGLLFYYKVPALVGGMLDARADAIRKELDEARRLREEAQALLADYQNKARDAEAMASETRKSLEENIARRSKMAEEKIARAEAQAVGEVRAAAVEYALAAAEKILKQRVSGSTADGLIDQSIKDLKGKLN